MLLAAVPWAPDVHPDNSRLKIHGGKITSVLSMCIFFLSLFSEHIAISTLSACTVTVNELAMTPEETRQALAHATLSYPQEGLGVF